jgi:hypothetical protein
VESGVGNRAKKILQPGAISSRRCDSPQPSHNCFRLADRHPATNTWRTCTIMEMQSATSSARQNRGMRVVFALHSKLVPGSQIKTTKIPEVPCCVHRGRLPPALLAHQQGRTTGWLCSVKVVESSRSTARRCRRASACCARGCLLGCFESGSLERWRQAQTAAVIQTHLFGGENVMGVQPLDGLDHVLHQLQ